MAAQEFVLELGRALHALGSASYRVEDAMDACCRRFGLRGSFFATPTAIFAAIGPEGAKPETSLLRVRPGEHDLGKLAALYDVRDAVMQGKVDAAEGLRRLAEVMTGPPTQSAWRRIPAWSVSSAAAALFLGGGAAEMVVACLTGLVVAIVAALLDRRRHLGRVTEPTCCALAAFAIQAAGARIHLDTSTAVVASIVPLLPGLTFTTALAELAVQHLAAGSARLLGSVAVLLTMAVGIGIGTHVGVVAFGDRPESFPEPIATWVVVPALFASALAYSVLLRASWRQVPWVLLAILVCYAGAELGGLYFERELRGFFGAFAVALTANLYAHFLRRPAAVLRTPGLLLLVPGSLGLRGLSTAMQGGFVAGGEFAFRMVLVGGAIVAGLLVASALVPPPLDVEPDAERAAARVPRR